MGILVAIIGLNSLPASLVSAIFEGAPLLNDLPVGVARPFYENFGYVMTASKCSWVILGEDFN